MSRKVYKQFIDSFKNITNPSFNVAQKLKLKNTETDQPNRVFR